MRCIFCKHDSSKSKTVEHIIPECLGNQEHVLTNGVVCDSCNAYFGLKVEKPLLDSLYFRQIRFRNSLFSKKDRIPTNTGFVLPGFIPIEMMSGKDGASIFTTRERDSIKLTHLVKKSKLFKIIDPIIDKPDELLMSRFLAKVSLELLALRFLKNNFDLDEVIDKIELNDIRNYARIGSSPKFWPYNMRIIYPEGKRFIEGTQTYEILHECTLLYTKSYELYSVVAIVGVEYVVNMGEPSLDGYKEWLIKHNFESPLNLKKETDN